MAGAIWENSDQVSSLFVSEAGNDMGESAIELHAPDNS